MNIIEYPTPYQSAFREVSFVVDGLGAPAGTDIEISSPHAGTLGTKRIYATGRAAVNAAPYVRRLLAPQPLCGSPAGMTVDEGRTAACRISSGGYTSEQVWLTAGVDDAPVNAILSAAPHVARIARGQVDELSIIPGEVGVKPIVTFNHNGMEYTDNSIAPYAGDRMATFVVDVDEVGARFADLTGAAAGEMAGFTVWLITPGGGFDPALSRRYGIAGEVATGRRLAWVNRYGAIDYCDFPTVAGGKIVGARARIYTPGGYRTVATAAESTQTLLSSRCDEAGVKWLSEIFSSPAVWLVDGRDCRRVEVSKGSAEYSPAHPGVVSVDIGSVQKTVSRRF